MRKVIVAAMLIASLSACGSRGGILNRGAPDEFQVSRAAPLVVPPDFALVPPKPGSPQAQAADSSTLALEAMFGGAAQRSSTETSAVRAAGGNRAQPGIRSNAGDPNTDVVDKGGTTRDILVAPEGDGAEAKTSAPQ